MAKKLHYFLDDINLTTFSSSTGAAPSKEPSPAPAPAASEDTAVAT